jgi:hypothetical protein
MQHESLAAAAAFGAAVAVYGDSIVRSQPLLSIFDKRGSGPVDGSPGFHRIGLFR